MAKIGQWKSEAARDAYLKAYASLSALWTIPFTEFDVETSYGKTHVRKCGSGAGTPLALIPPVMGNGAVWYPIIERLAAERTVYALDIIGGPGLSVQTAPITGRADYAGWLDETLAALDLPHAHIMGYSDGGWRAFMAGVDGSKRIASLLLVEAGGAVGKTPWGVLFKMIRYAIPPSEKNMRKAAEWLMPGNIPVDEEMACAKAGLGYRTRSPWPQRLKDEELQAITAPVLLIYGADSVLGDAEASAARALQQIPRCEVEIYPGATHGLLFQGRDMDAVLDRILGFADRHDPAKAPHTN
ncbi:alpha/beta fold hydrolase [Nocardia seriolae]|uniref:Carboxylesterase n=1 Tax=Nocardia seriolae TaxID=37332 RepID=A0A0B8N836_9NOCA|nr:alpha/beta hydrolase [Nocardia seriolae]APA98145.1 Carboxylesterase [Nocardia seriolae]MTJ62830.1 alpha/beta fold hydrolase [Nocardia seriolae]MTJ73506.1 alpha/beta fold hydrolase [Nocardia seriolae]MTJ87864.1 alpha/beta fold hydrolase [Nocardia seriolae]MTK31857.1 alpha/beta fold hydrolase [Nocardia seriolae]